MTLAIARDQTASDHLVHGWSLGTIADEIEIACADDEVVVVCPAFAVGERLGPGRHRWRNPDLSRPAAAYFVLTSAVEVPFSLVSRFVLPSTGKPVELYASGAVMVRCADPSILVAQFVGLPIDDLNGGIMFSVSSSVERLAARLLMTRLVQSTDPHELMAHELEAELIDAMVSYGPTAGAVFGLELARFLRLSVRVEGLGPRKRVASPAAVPAESPAESPSELPSVVVNEVVAEPAEAAPSEAKPPGRARAFPTRIGRPDSALENNLKPSSAAVSHPHVAGFDDNEATATTVIPSELPDVEIEVQASRAATLPRVSPPPAEPRQAARVTLQNKVVPPVSAATVQSPMARTLPLLPPLPSLSNGSTTTSGKSQAEDGFASESEIESAIATGVPSFVERDEPVSMSMPVGMIGSGRIGEVTEIPLAAKRPEISADSVVNNSHVEILDISNTDDDSDPEVIIVRAPLRDGDVFEPDEPVLVPGPDGRLIAAVVRNRQAGYYQLEIGGSGETVWVPEASVVAAS